MNTLKISTFVLSAFLGFFLWHKLSPPITNESIDSSNEPTIASTSQKPIFTGKKQSSNTLAKAYSSVDSTVNKPVTNKALLDLCKQVKSLSADQLLLELALYYKAYKYDGSPKEMIFNILYTELVQKDFEKALSFYQKHHTTDPTSSDSWPGILFDTWLDKDFDAAMAYIKKNNTKETPMFLDHLIMKKKLIRDPKSALLELSQSKLNLSAINFDPLTSSRSPQDTMKLIDGIILTPEQKKNLLTSIARQWTGKDEQLTEQWINSLSGDDKKEAQSITFSLFIENNPKEALKKLEGNHAEYQYFFEHDNIRNVVFSMAIKDPMQAKDWILKNAPQGNPKGIEKVVTVLCGQDPSAAQALIEELPEGPAKSDAIENLVQYHEGLSLKEKLDYLTRNNERTLRYKDKFEELLKTWDKEDPSAVQAWLNQSTISNKEKDYLKERVADKHSMIYTSVGN